jgi:hypothetical protein
MSATQYPFCEESIQINPPQIILNKSWALHKNNWADNNLELLFHHQLKIELSHYMNASLIFLRIIIRQVEQNA